MALPVCVPQLPAVVGGPWGCSPGNAGRSELDLSQLWISAPRHNPVSLADSVTGGWMSPGTSSSSAQSDFAALAQLVTNPGAASFPGTGRQYSDSGLSALESRLVLNHNKAITKKLAAAVHYQQVLDCVADSIQYFDEVNVATALHRVAKLQPLGQAKLQPLGQGTQMSPIVYADQFQQLITAVRRLLHRFEAQAVSNTMWAFATLGYRPEDNLLEDVANHAVGIMTTFRPQATANTLWAFAKLSYCPCEALLHASTQQMLRDLPRSVPQDISNTLWALATLRHHPGKELMAAAARQAVLTVQQFKPQEVANTLWSFAILGHDPGPQMLDAMAMQLVTRIQLTRPQAVSNSLWAYAKLGYNPGKLLVDVASRKAAGMLHQYTSQELANTLWAIATLQHHPGAAVLDAASIQIVRRMEHFTAQDIANSIWAFAELFHRPSQELLNGVALFLLRHWPRFKASELAHALLALALLRSCSLQTWDLLATKLAAMPPSSFDDASLEQLFQTCALIDATATLAGLAPTRPSLPAQLVEACELARKASIRKTGELSMTHTEVSRVLWRLGILHHNEFITPDGHFCIDVALEGTNVVLDVQEPEDFVLNSRAPLGQTFARHIMLESRGYAVLSVPYFDWRLLQSLEQREQYLSSLIASAALSPPRVVARPLPVVAAPAPAGDAVSGSAGSSAPESPHLPPSSFGLPG